ncbi:MAG: PAS domain-containing sensor histidine kinase [Bacteroidia bacterium]
MLKNFRLRILLWVSLLFILLSLVLWAWQAEQYYLAGLLSLGLGYAIFGLIRYVEKTNRDLSRFFNAVKYNDFTLNPLPDSKGSSFTELYEGFNLVNQRFLDVRAEKEANHQFLQTLIKHVDIGLLCINSEDEVILMNQALQKLLHKSYLVKVDSLQKVDPKLWDVVEQLQSGQRELLKINIQNSLLHLSIQCAEIILQGESIKLISFQNIQNELEAQELIAWQKLIRILTHEIMNSVAPISSLSATIQKLLEGKDELKSVDLERLRKSIAVIERRSEGLLGFTETYRTLTRIPPPQFQEVRADELFDEVVTLMQPDLDKGLIQVQQQIKGDKLSFSGDPHLLEQVLINLLKNAIDALQETPNAQIQLNAFTDTSNRICLQVVDNGAGIPENKMEEIFIPFFTTKEDGSGIGLSLSRQIIRMHQGSLDLQSEEGSGTSVSIWI